MQHETVEVFFSYAHEDEALRDDLAKHLKLLNRKGVIRSWHDRQILPGQNWDGQISEHLNSAQIILLLVSSDFLASDYCWKVEVARAIERHELKKACVIPIVLRPCNWFDAPFGNLKALPSNAKAVTNWADRDLAFLDITEGICKAAENLTTKESGLSLREKINVSPQQIDVSFVRNERPDEIEKIFKAISINSQHDNGSVIVLWGASGSGKTTLAQAVCSLKEAKERFTRGIFWVTLSNKSVESEFESLYSQVTNSKEKAHSLDVMIRDLRERWDHSDCLIVLDNLKEENDLGLFYSAGIKNCVWLVTAQDQTAYFSFLTQGIADEIQIDSIKPEIYANTILHDLRKRHRLNKREELEIWDKINDIVLAINSYPPSFSIIREELTKRHPSIGYNAEMALEATLIIIRDKGIINLSEKTTTRDYKILKQVKELSIFRKRADIPLSMLMKLRKERQGETIELCEQLARSSKLDEYNPLKTIRLNRSSFKELKKITPSETEIHRLLVDHYIENEIEVHKKLVGFYKNLRAFGEKDDSDMSLSIEFPEYIPEEEKLYLIRFYAWHIEQAKLNY